jgi:hypothetical protein
MADAEVNRAIGRIEGQLEGILATLKRVDDRSAARDGAFEGLADRLGALEEHQKHMIVVTKEFNALQQAIRDGKMQGKGVLIGIGIAAGTGGAAVATFFKGLWVAVFGGA